MEVGKQQNTEMDKTVIIDGTDTVPIKRRLGYFSGVALIVGSIIGMFLSQYCNIYMI